MAFLVVLPIAMLCAVYYDKRIEETLALPMIWASLLAYFCGIIYELWIAKYIIAGLAVVSLAGAVFIGYKKKNLRNLFTIGIAEFGVLAAYYMLIMRDRRIIGQDGLQIYERYVADFYYVDDINRFTAQIGLMMWKYLSLKFWPNYSEGIQLLGPVVLCVALFLFIFSFKGENKKDILIKSLVGLFFIVIIPINFRDNLGYFTMQYDLTAGIMTAYIICAYKRLLDTKDVFYKILILSSLFMLVQIKTNGFILAAVCILIFVGMDMATEKASGFKAYKFSISSGAVVLLSKLSWSIFCKLNSSNEKFSVGKALSKLNAVAVVGLIVAFMAAAAVMLFIVYKKHLVLYIVSVIALAAAIFAGTAIIVPGDIRVSAVVSFIRVVVSNFAVDREFGIGTVLLIPYIILILAFPVLLYMLSKDKADEALNRTNRMLVILVNMGFVFYSSVVFLTNLYGRTHQQTAKAKECERYLFAYMIIFIAVYLFLYMHDYCRSDMYKPIMFLLVMITFFITKKSFLYAPIKERPEVPLYNVESYIELTDKDKFFFVDQRKEHVAEHFYFRTAPARMVKWDYVDLYLSLDGKNEPLSYDEWIEQLRSCTYVYLATTAEDFETTYGDIFEDEIVDGRIYTVTVAGDSVRLKSINY